jgi:hypothetical protein
MNEWLKLGSGAGRSNVELWVKAVTAAVAAERPIGRGLRFKPQES